MWARGRCRISPLRFLAECCKRQLNQVSFVLLLSTFSDLYWVFFICIFLYCFVCQYQSSDWLWRPPPKWPILCQVGVKLYSNSNSNVIFHGPNLLLSYRIVSYNEHIGLRGSRRRFSRPSDVCCRLLSITEQTKWLSEYNFNGRLQERINVVTGCEISRQKTQFMSSFLRQILKCWRVNHVWNWCIEIQYCWPEAASLLPRANKVENIDREQV